MRQNSSLKELYYKNKFIMIQQLLYGNIYASPESLQPMSIQTVEMKRLRTYLKLSFLQLLLFNFSN
jgi:hypothetical protein